MAFVIELDNYYIQQEKLTKQSCLYAENISHILLYLKKSLVLGGTQTITLDKQKDSNGYELMFTAKIDKNSELLYRFWDQKAHKISSRITLFQKNNYLRARSSEIRKNICKKIALINSTSQKSQVYLLVNQVSNQFQFLSSIYQSHNQSKQKIYTNLKNMISQCLFFAKNYLTLILYKSNLITKYALLTECTESIRSHLISKVGQFSFLNGIREQMSYSNINISSTLKETKQCKIEKNFHENISKIIKIYNNRNYPHDIILFTQTNDFIKQRKITKEFESFTEGMLSYKPPPCMNFDNNLIFSTIFIQQQDKIKQNLKCIATNTKTQLYYFKGKIKYGYSSPLNDKYNSSEEEVIAQTKALENYLSPSASKSIQKGIVMKTVNKSLSPQLKKKVEYMINYEKAVVRNFRGAQCMYLPKYYQTIQKYSYFRECLLIDFIPGSNLGDIIIKRNHFLTFSWKLHLLMHLANALRFLQYYDIAHLDLSVNNIILTPEGIPKIIDFGEAYHEQTIRKQKNFRMTAKSNDPAFIPGRTFPFAPPETSQRTWNFNSKQDIFSLGMIGFILVMGYLPHNCSQTKIEELYKNKNYDERIYLSPQGLEWIGEIEVVTSCLQLIMSCFHKNQKMRPNSSFVHLIFKKMFDLVENIL